MQMWCHDNMPALYVLTKRKFANIDGVRILGGESHSSPYLVLAVWLAQMLLAYLQKSTIDIWHTSPLISQVVSMRLTLCGHRCIRYKNVFTYCINDHKTFLGLRALGAQSWLIARQTHNPYRMIGTILKQTLSWGDGSEIHITQWEDTYLLTLS
jgi:hypothetical protein